MRLYWELARLSFRRQLAYRAASLAGIMTNMFFGLLRAAVLVALYGARTEVSDLSVQDAITFTGLSQSIIVVLGLFGWYDLMNSIDSGEVASDLLKPLDYFRFWLARDFGRSAGAFITRAMPILALYALFFDISVPGDLLQWVGMSWALVQAWLLGFVWRFLINLTAFWSPNALGTARFGFALSWFLSGFLMPLRYFPEWFVALCNLTPFPSMVNTFVEAYLGVISGPALLQALLVQAGWILALTLVSQSMLRSGVRRLVIQGG